MRTIVYDLWFLRSYANRVDTELRIGVYATPADAENAIARLQAKPGFRDAPEAFEIFELEIGRTWWQNGFVTTFGPPPKDAATEAFDLPAWIEACPPLDAPSQDAT